MGIQLTRSRARALGLRPAKQPNFATEVDAFVASAAPAVAEDRRRVGESTYALVRADGRGDNLLDVLQSEPRRGRKKELVPEEKDFLERRLGAVVKEESGGDTEVEFFLHPDEIEERWKSIQALSRRSAES